MKKMLLAILLLIVSSSSYAEIRQISDISQILPAITRDSLVIFDLDNTVMEAPQTIGTDQWFQYLVKQRMNEGMDRDGAIDQVVPQWIEVQDATPMAPTQKITPLIIRYLQEKGVTVMALTARPLSLARRTVEELVTLGVNFALKPIYNRNTLIGNSRSAGYFRGVALIGPHGDKGTALVSFLRQIHKAPHSIIFVDDTARNTASVEAALANDPFSHVSFRYGYDDAKVAGFNPAVADLE